MKNNCCLTGLGYYVPEKIMTNHDFALLMDTSDEWITTRTGIKQRHVCTHQACSDLAYQSSVLALKEASLTPRQLTHVIVATFTPDAFIPNAACLLLEKLGHRNIAALDINTACTGFIYGLELARGLCMLPGEANVLVVASEVLTSRVNFADRVTCVLFGDGAGAAVVSSSCHGAAGMSGRLVDVNLKADGALGELLTLKGGGSAHPLALGDTVTENFFVQMAGREVFKHAVRSMYNVSMEILERNNIRSGDIDLVVPHQANIRIIEALAKKMNLDPANLFVNVQKYGNTSAASVPIALAEAKETGRINPGDLVLLVAFGGGFTWGSALVQY
ncbi:beta-ketoacyl-ACP synthase III [Desulfonatronospira sp.]|uniref:beta-ketoacyl-ACP synthase III n=1 Tax=Desulfonatronospira sp. TaxID=1962951 RepID=UPI0025B7C089|nr:beta-ketoacyl-ACP synthase III [Desulfonatronospira sp.]